ncbi:MAG: hypothetical protein K9J12_11050 [Melioribacteraceae bacterium]|nr:hypothetical protein [Melioribacteraceae bacterium]MCF8264766.1 hypothetical protein [Melioribacteraceae bacterium]MCF8413723.1 hypothetical protein [Melioribacteraceae bacterium]
MYRKIILAAIFASIPLVSCSSQKEGESGNDKMQVENFEFPDSLIFDGRITRVGNEPFTKLGLMLDEKTVYLIECDSETKETLLDHQGQLYKIYAKEKLETATGIKLVLAKAEKLIEKN